MDPSLPHSNSQEKQLSKGEEIIKKRDPDSVHRDLELGLMLSSRSSSTRGSSKSSSELNLIDSFELTRTSSSQQYHHQERPLMEERSVNNGGGHDLNNNESNYSTDPRVFSCNYCQRKFYSSQALGGHQNAHKRERTLAKRGNFKMGLSSSSSSALAFGHNNVIVNRFPNMASLPLHGSANRSTSLGIQAHSTIHKPYNFGQTPSSTIHMLGPNGFSRENIHQKPAPRRILPERFHVGANVDAGGAFSGTSGIAVRFEGLNHFKSKQEDHQLKKLDLTLKL